MNNDSHPTAFTAMAAVLASQGAHVHPAGVYDPGAHTHSINDHSLTHSRLRTHGDNDWLSEFGTVFRHGSLRKAIDYARTPPTSPRLRPGPSPGRWRPMPSIAHFACTGRATTACARMSPASDSDRHDRLDGCRRAHSCTAKPRLLRPRFSLLLGRRLGAGFQHFETICARWVGTKVGVADRTRINVYEDREFMDWCKTLDVTEEELLKAVIAVGNRADDVRAYLGKE